MRRRGQKSPPKRTVHGRRDGQAAERSFWQSSLATFAKPTEDNGPRRRPTSRTPGFPARPSDTASNATGTSAETQPGKRRARVQGSQPTQLSHHGILLTDSDKQLRINNLCKRIRGVGLAAQDPRAPRLDPVPHGIRQPVEHLRKLGGFPVRSGFTTLEFVSSKSVSTVRSRVVKFACATPAAISISRSSGRRSRHGSALPSAGGHSDGTRTEAEVSTKSVQRIGTSLSNSLVMSRSRRAEIFQAMVFGGSPGR